MYYEFEVQAITPGKIFKKKCSFKWLLHMNNKFNNIRNFWNKNDTW